MRLGPDAPSSSQFITGMPVPENAARLTNHDEPVRAASNHAASVRQRVFLLSVLLVVSRSQHRALAVLFLCPGVAYFQPVEMRPGQPALLLHPADDDPRRDPDPSGELND